MSQRQGPQLRIEVGKPCGADWDSMTGDDRVRRCHHCERNVYNVSQLSADEVRDLLRQTEKRVCGRVFRRADGTAVTSDCHDRPTLTDDRNARKARPQFSLRGLMVAVTTAAIAFLAMPWINRTLVPVFAPIITGWFESKPPMPPSGSLEPIDEVWMGDMQMLDPEENDLDERNV